MTWGMVAVAGATVVGGVMASNAAGSAADAQSAAAAQSDATQRYQYDTTRADNAPFRETGVAANNRLAYLMGLGGADGPGSGGFTEKPPTIADAWAIEDERHRARFGSNSPRGAVQQTYVDSRLADLLSQYEAKKSSYEAQHPRTAQQDADYGALTRNFTMADRDADPVYQSGLQFGLDEGVKGINRIASASGSMLSGATLKALTKYGNDYGSTKANESYNRFNNNQDRSYNKLAGLSGAGQQATNQVSAAGQNMANNISASQIGVGNARAASSIGQANALVGAMNQGVSAWNGYNQNQAMLNAPGAAFQPNSSWINNNGGGF